ncbi:MAG TPA: alkyl sulfatase dimerization domain-containing protein, partial [Enhygromyxa sp.]|nr:alkyl sulfatase dimerization domain-containing protein [Enhygromyxa sp.]
MALAVALVVGCARDNAVVETRVYPTPAMLDEQCREAIGEPRIERFELDDAVSIHVAIGYDLANTILIHTPDGNVIVDAMTGTPRAEQAKTDLLAQAPGPIAAVILTHSHIDHVGGTASWAPLGGSVPIWATAGFTEHFFKQYGVFQAAEQARGKRQFGARVSAENLPCSALGRRIDFGSNVGDGVRLPTDTFSGTTTLTVGGLTIELHEAPGETDDQLFVWLPDHRVLLPGDNVYRTFPNLYTIRGTRPRPVDAWIASLDRMRKLAPALLIGSHTIPTVGEQAIAELLRDYRDAIAFLRASVVRGANAGLSRAEIADAVTLPVHLADKPWLRELYGQLDWSALSIYDAELGWFDGSPEALYPLPSPELARREIELMGGFSAVREAARQSDDPRFALHLLAKLRRSGLGDEPQRAELEQALATALREVAAGVSNTNGRAYLFEYALELEHGPAPSVTPALSDEFLREIPISLFFEAMPVRLKLELAG